MAYDLGSAYIQIVPTTKGLGKGIEKELSGVGGRASKQMGGKLWGGLKAGAVGAGVAIGGILTGSIVKGFSRLKDIENAEAKLSGLGHSARDVEKIMNDALASVKGTSYGMGEAASAAATAVAAGVKPGKDLQRYLGLVGDTAAIAGVSMRDMASIFGKVQTSGKVQGEVFAQLGDAGIPVVQLLADELGVAAEEVYRMGSAGEISSEDFLHAMGSMEGSALKMGGTTEGAWKNMGAAMGRFGATLLKDVYPLVGPLLGKLTEFFDYLSATAGPAIENIVEKFKAWASSDGVQDFMGKLREVGEALYEKVLKPLGTWVSDNWKPIAGFLGGIAAFFVGGAIVTAIGAVGGSIAAFVGGISWIAVAVGAAVAGLTHFFTETETGKKYLGAFVSFVRDTLVPGIVDGFKLVRDFVVNELWPMIKSRFDAIRDLAVAVWQGVIQPAFEQFAGYLRDTVFPIIQRLWTEYVQPAFLAIGALAVWLWNNAIKPAMSALDGFIRNTLGPGLVWLWQNVVSPVFSAIGKFIGWVWNTLIFPALDALKYFVTKVVGPAFKWLWETVKAAWSGIQNAVKAVVSWFQTWVWPVISLVIELIKLGFNGLKTALKTAWDFIKDRVIAPVVNWFRDTVWPIISRVIDNIVGNFTWLRDKVKAVWNFLKDKVISPVANWFRDTIQPLFKKATDATGKSFSGMKDAIKKAWDGIKNAAKAPIRFVVDTVINDALIGNFNKLAKKLGTKELPSVSLPSGFARGGVLPGMSRMSDGDDQLVPMRRGEGVLVSEGLRTREDRAAFMAANAAGRRGVGFASLMGGGFAGGGILGDAWRGAKRLAGDALDSVLDGVDFVAEALRDPSSIFTKLYDSVVGQMPGAGLFGDAAKGASKKLLSSVIGTVKDAITPPAPEFTGAKAGGSLGMAQSLAAAHGLTMTSFMRRGARTAGSGSVSLHSQGRAMDFSNSSGPTPQMMAFFNAMHPYKPTELLYSPAGGRQWRRGGYMADTSGATKRGHYNHVHVGFAGGGIFDKPFLHDSGGWHNPGELSINQTRKPEAVLTNGQWQNISALIGDPAGRGQTIVQVQAPSTEDPGTWGRRVAESLDLHRLAATAGGI